VLPVLLQRFAHMCGVSSGGVIRSPVAQRACVQILSRLTLLIRGNTLNLAAAVESLDFDFLTHITNYISAVSQNTDIFNALLRLLEALAVHTMTVKHLKVYMRLFAVRSGDCCRSALISVRDR
jgi:hypothetical protein